MPSAPYQKVTPSVQWLSIIGQVLGSDGVEQRRAREMMWNEVGFYVEKMIGLPIGPLNDDDDARRDIAVKVLAKLEAKGFASLHEWYRRQQRGVDRASWWAWIRTIARRTAIDFARSHPANVAPRGLPFAWVRTEPSDPAVLDEALEAGANLDPFMATAQLHTALGFLSSCEEARLTAHLATVQSNLTGCRPFEVDVTATGIFTIPPVDAALPEPDLGGDDH
jgi:hypothetical protein